MWESGHHVQPTGSHHAQHPWQPLSTMLVLISFKQWCPAGTCWSLVIMCSRREATMRNTHGSLSLQCWCSSPLNNGALRAHVGVWSSCAADGKPPCATPMAASLYIAGADLPCRRAITAVASLSTHTTSCYGVCDACCMLHERLQLATQVDQHLHYGGHSCTIQSSQHV